MKCNVCGREEIPKVFSARILHKYDVDYYQCPQCGLIFTEFPYWLNEAYNNSISKLDTGIMDRNLSVSMEVNFLLSKYFDRTSKFLDFAGGYGIFTRMMRDLGYDFYWRDKYSENLVARGFEYGGQKVELVTALEVFEHFDDPMTELKNLLKYSENILFTTILYDNQLKVKEKDWWYYAFETGQHISFYSRMTLEYMASVFGLKYYKVKEGLHLFTRLEINEKILQKKYRSQFTLRRNWLKSRKHGKAFSDMMSMKKNSQ